MPRLNKAEKVERVQQETNDKMMNFHQSVLDSDAGVSVKQRSAIELRQLKELLANEDTVKEQKQLIGDLREQLQTALASITALQATSEQEQTQYAAQVTALEARVKVLEEQRDSAQRGEQTKAEARIDAATHAAYQSAQQSVQPIRDENERLTVAMTTLISQFVPDKDREQVALELFFTDGAA